MSSIGVPPRRKQWAPRVRTGCHTCRLRRIKCDETQPVCKRCLAGGRDCQYSLVWRPPNGDESGTQARSNVLSIAPLQQAQTPDSHIMQAIRYYTTVVYPQAVRTLASNTYKQTMDPRLHISNQTSPPAFIMLQMSHRISTLCQQNSALTRQHAVPDMAVLWRTFYVYMGQSITLLNHYITNRSPIALTLFRVIDFICAGLVIAELPWRSHTRGFLTLVQHHGGVQAVLNSSDLPDILPALQFVLLTATMANTTSPSTDQISQLYDWTDGQCLSVFAFSFCESLPCPSSLFLAIRRITRLRIALAAGVSIHNLIPTATLIAHQVHEYSPNSWVETYTIPPPEISALYARAFKLATILYALLSLPATLSQPFAQQVGQGQSDASQGISDARIYYRKLLWDAVVFGERGLISSPPGRMCWPLAVLGVACYDSTAQEHNTITSLLAEMRGSPSIDSGPALLLDTLPRFWASGKTAWDDCFDTPVHTWIWSISSYIVQMKIT